MWKVNDKWGLVIQDIVVTKNYKPSGQMRLLVLSSLLCLTYGLGVAEAADPPENWQYYKRVIIDHTKVSTNLTNFPVLIDITDSDLQLHAQIDGDDVLFTDCSNNKIPHEIELYESGTGHLIAWVNTDLSSTEDTTVYMYYGNNATSNQENATNVWDSNYVMVQHLQETSGNHSDSTSNNNDGTPNGVNQDAPGKIDGSDDFSGSDYIEVPDSASLDITGNFTLEAWVNYSSTSGIQRIIDKLASGASSGFDLGSGWTTNKIEVYARIGGSLVGSGVSTTTIQADTWYYVTGVYDGERLRLYVNGTEENNNGASGAVATNNLNLRIGDGSYYHNYFNGIIDDVRISDTARDGNWIKTSYINQNDPCGFYSISNEMVS